MFFIFNLLSFLRVLFYYFSFKSRLSTSLEDQIFDMFHIRTINQVIQSAKTMRTFKLSSLLLSLIKMDIYQILFVKISRSRENKLVFGFSITFYYSFFILCVVIVFYFIFLYVRNNVRFNVCV